MPTTDFTTNWTAYDAHGSYFRLVKGVLWQAPMNLDGTADLETICTVEWDNLEGGDVEDMEQVQDELECGASRCPDCDHDVHVASECPKSPLGFDGTLDFNERKAGSR